MRNVDANIKEMKKMSRENGEDEKDVTMEMIEKLFRRNMIDLQDRYEKVRSMLVEGEATQQDVVAFVIVTLAGMRDNEPDVYTLINSIVNIISADTNVGDNNVTV